MKKVLLIGGNSVFTGLFAQSTKEKYGDDVVVVTPEEAKEKGMDLSEFVNVPTYEIKAPPTLPDISLLNPLIGYDGGGRGKGQRARNRSKFKK